MMHSITDYTPDPECTSCLGDGLVCEEHPMTAWDSCSCGAPGMPCGCITWPCGGIGPRCICSRDDVPSWYHNAKWRAGINRNPEPGGEDRFAYWCSRAVDVINRGETVLVVTPAEYSDIRKAFDNDPDERARLMRSYRNTEMKFPEDHRPLPSDALMVVVVKEHKGDEHASDGVRVE